VNGGARLATLGDLAYMLSPAAPLPWMCGVAGSYGRLRYALQRRVRYVAERNLATALGAQTPRHEVAALARRAFEYRQLRVLLLYIYPRLRPARREALFPLTGLEHLDRALGEDAGVILLGSHLNSILTFVAKDRLRERGYDARVVLPTPSRPYAPTALRRVHDRLWPGATMMGEDGWLFAQFNVRPLVRSLHERAAVILMGDGYHSAAFVEAPFFGRRLPFTTAWASLARTTGAPVVPLFVTGTPPSQVEIRLEAPIPRPQTGSLRDDLVQMVGAYANRLEAHVRHAMPCWEHWFRDGLFERDPREQSLSLRYQV